MGSQPSRLMVFSNEYHANPEGFKMSYNKLYFNMVDFKMNPDGSVEFRPNLICPKCRTYTDGKLDAKSPTYVTKTTIPVSIVSKVVDFNQRVALVMPCCGSKIELYVAIHDAALCMSVESISVDWWKTSETK